MVKGTSLVVQMSEFHVRYLAGSSHKLPFFHREISNSSYLHGYRYASSVRRRHERPHETLKWLIHLTFSHWPKLKRESKLGALLCLQTWMNAPYSPSPATTQVHMKDLSCPCLAMQPNTTTYIAVVLIRGPATSQTDTVKCRHTRCPMTSPSSLRADQDDSRLLADTPSRCNGISMLRVGIPT